MKPNYQKTLRERIDQAKRADNLHKRPNTEDYSFWDAIGEVDRLRGSLASKTVPSMVISSPQGRDRGNQ